jgi:nucleoside-diphosphate-sugar epimerase
MIAAKPEVVIHQLTDLPDVSDPAQMTAVREKNSRLRIEGTRNLMAAAKPPASGASWRKASPSSMRRDQSPYREERPARFERGPARDHRGRHRPSNDAVLNTPGIDGVVLRYGRLYGPGTWFEKPGSAGALTTAAAAAGCAARGDPRCARPLQRCRGRRRVSRSRRPGPALGFDPKFRMP